MSGLNSVCVKGHSSKQYSSNGAAAHYQGLTVSVFVTSGSTSEPIGSIVSNTHSSFSLQLTETQETSRTAFKTYAPKYFAGFSFTHFTSSDPSLCADRAPRVFAIGGSGTFGNTLPGISIFEKAQGTCLSTPEFNTKFATQSINGHIAQVWSNCAGVATGKCGSTQVKANGGLVIWTIPGSKTMKATVVSVTSYNLSLATLLSVARSIR